MVRLGRTVAINTLSEQQRRPRSKAARYDDTGRWHGIGIELATADTTPHSRSGQSEISIRIMSKVPDTRVITRCGDKSLAIQFFHGVQIRPTM